MILLAEKFQVNTWGTTNEFLQVETDFDAVVSEYKLGITQ